MTFFPVRMTFSSSVVDADPGTGNLRLNNAAQASATQIFLDDESLAAVDVQELWRLIDDGLAGSPAIGGLVYVQKVDDEAGLVFEVTSANVEAAGYHKLNGVVTAVVGGANPLADGDTVEVGFVPAGNVAPPGSTGATGATGPAGSDGAKGDKPVTYTVTGAAPSSGLGVEGDLAVRSDTGELFTKYAGVWVLSADLTGPTGAAGGRGLAGGGVPYTWSELTTISDPGPGGMRFSHSTQPQTITIAVDDLDAGGNDIQAFYRSWDDLALVPHGYLLIQAADDPGARGHWFKLTQVVEQSGYFQLAVTWIAALGASNALLDGETVLLTFLPVTPQADAGFVVSDTASVDLTLTTSPVGLSADVKPAGVDHNSLANVSAGDVHTQYIKVDGSRAFSGSQSLGSQRITSLGEPSADTDAIARKYGWSRNSATLTIADDAVGLITGHGSQVFVFMLQTGTNGTSWVGCLYTQSGVGSATMFGGTDWEHLAVSDTAPTGTTGSDNKISWQADATGTTQRLWLENRSGNSISVRVWVLGTGYGTGLAFT